MTTIEELTEKAEAACYRNPEPMSAREILAAAGVPELLAQLERIGENGHEAEVSRLVAEDEADDLRAENQRLRLQRVEQVRTAPFGEYARVHETEEVFRLVEEETESHDHRQAQH